MEPVAGVWEVRVSDKGEVMKGRYWITEKGERALEVVRTFRAGVLPESKIRE